MHWKPDAIFQQGTSSDPGPGYLGRGECYADRAGIKHDLSKMITSALDLKIPLLCSLGGGGGNAGLEACLTIIDEITKELGRSFRAAVIASEIDKEFLKRKLRQGTKVKALDSHIRMPEYLTSEMVDASKVIVAQMGTEPIVKAMDQGVKMIFTGRANDTSLPMAVALRNGFPKGLSLQMAKVVECSGLAVLREDHVLFPSLNFGADPKLSWPSLSKNPISVISHGVFYERRDPTRPEYMPGGHLDITNATWEEVPEGTRAAGGVWVDDPYTVKVEGVEMIGHRTICLTGMRDPWLISKVEDGSYLKMAQDTARKKISDAGISDADYKLSYKVYGLNAVMGALETRHKITSHEIAILVDAVGRDPEISKTVCMFGRLQILHLPYPGRLSTAGNVAIAFSPSDIYVGETYVFNIWHLLPLGGEEKHEIFKTTFLEFPRR